MTYPHVVREAGVESNDDQSCVTRCVRWSCSRSSCFHRAAARDVEDITPCRTLERRSIPAEARLRRYLKHAVRVERVLEIRIEEDGS